MRYSWTEEHLSAGFSPRLNASAVVIVSLDIGGYNETPGRQKHTLTHSLQQSTGAATAVIVFSSFHIVWEILTNPPEL